MKENSTGRKPFSRSRLVKELSWSCELPQTKISAILDTLAELARREARSTFILPGICKLEVVRRKPRKMRNPRTGESFMLPERDALRITAPRSLKLACAKVIAPAPVAPAAEEKKTSETAPTPTEPVAKAEKPVEPPPVAMPAWSNAPAPTEPEAEKPSEPAAAEAVAVAENPVEPTVEQDKPSEPTAEEQDKPSEPAEEPFAETAEAETAPEEPVEPPPAVDPDALISFRCPRCHQEVEATGDMVGMETECPTCGNPITVPAESEPDTIHAAGSNNDGSDGPIRHAQTVSTREAESLSPEKLKGLTIRINVSDLGLDTPPEPPAEPPAEQMITFVCDACKQEIEASRDLIGEAMLCPGCGAPITVPAESAASAPQEGAAEEDPKIAQAMKARTMRIDMGDDF